jgi:hypothetical protein
MDPVIEPTPKATAKPTRPKRSRERGPARYGFWTDAKLAQAISRSIDTAARLRKAGAFDKDDGMSIAEFVRKFRRRDNRKRSG